MPPVTRSRRASTRSYISQFTPQSSQPVVDISDDETVPMEEEDPTMMTEVDDDDENWMDSPVAAAPVPPIAPASPAVPVAPAAPTPPAPPVAPAAPAVPEVVPLDGPEEEDPGWTTTIHYKYPSLTAYFHNLLREMLDAYYADKEIGIRYCCAEYTHPYEATYWRSDLTITVGNEAHDSYMVESIHGHIARRAEAQDSMEDAVQMAYTHYHGLRYEAMTADQYKFLPRHDSTIGTWSIENPQEVDTPLDATVRHMHVLQMANDDLQEELRDQ
ncbi:uncharacterized protein LOC110431427 [Sorghum bicolor]|uniref:uncharacterized protein LOC110431427 n=1 Tax=Sorghum bicolor TaxID=4558 RepID=UPI000B425DAF|nr:uncharacterized protein LOC110431427 [Sorghum bicolor]XP_021306222.1 uncharacterized protein LOC110431427 [Sorghum bicolor]XP_021306223.1 uncharacterized protein LOC110431427 [Sorghum bicolor]XP_021306224.1 uncharacterized protein LOC110431427 [Sorghum bicolor]XP_021306225.1 uncharacterized protein LOC110431427 [Sorghum bicolor]XP_021306226.1 uncharacterized protein LOC110431427 [Sorghum bicolor]XP_021306227.1 uncharacterized protein LOC110431427 [Sorghum bicolor]XP_021306228.1 uncharacte|eukprot:XP_021306221.1 uncharacterized protein LOC110431427 [Sorghum bicolor]